MTLYDILGISPSSTDDEIKKAYRNMLKAFHPDLYNGDKDFAASMTQRIVDAYSILRDPMKRMEYDNALFHQDKRNQRYESDTKKEEQEFHTSKSQQQKWAWAWEGGYTPNKATTGVNRKKRIFIWFICASLVLICITVAVFYEPETVYYVGTMTYTSDCVMQVSVAVKQGLFQDKIEYVTIPGGINLYPKGEYIVDGKKNRIKDKSGTYWSLETLWAPMQKPITPYARTSGNYCGSLNGEVYHTQFCPYIGQIKKNNLIYFNYTIEANAYGLRPCSRCLS